MKSLVRKCRKCGRDVCLIARGIYRTVLVDAEAVDVIPDAEGEEFLRIDGSKVRGREAEPGTLQTDHAYRPHCKTCGVSE